MDDLVKQTIQTNVHNTLNALDCVSRQYALGHYQYVCRRTNCKECPLHIKATDMGDTFTDCELELFLYNLPSAQPEPRWIAVEDRLPERGEEGACYNFACKRIPLGQDCMVRNTDV